MSGGSYNYICYDYHDFSDLLRKQQNIQEMADRLAGLSEEEFPGVTVAAQRTIALLEDMRIASLHIETRAKMLSDVWKSIEWWDSSDWGPDHVRDALKEYATPES